MNKLSVMVCRVMMYPALQIMYKETEGRADGLVIIEKCNIDVLKRWQGKYKNISDYVI